MTDPPRIPDDVARLLEPYVEQAARAMCERDRGALLLWKDEPEWKRIAWRADARAALSALPWEQETASRTPKGELYRDGAVVHDEVAVVRLVLPWEEIDG